MILSGIVGFLAGGIVGYILGILVKLFSRGRYPRKIHGFACTLAIGVAIVFAIAGIFEFMPTHLSTHLSK